MRQEYLSLVLGEKLPDDEAKLEALIRDSGAIFSTRLTLFYIASVRRDMGYGVKKTRGKHSTQIILETRNLTDVLRVETEGLPFFLDNENITIRALATARLKYGWGPFDIQVHDRSPSWKGFTPPE
jgi:hypothetical protein